MDELKGIGKVLLTCVYPTQVELLQFADESVGIRKNGRIVGVWEPLEFAECFRTFSHLAGLERWGEPLVELLVLKRSAPAITITEQLN